MPPLVYADVVIQSGISFDAFGLVLELGKNQPGMHIRDMMQISSKLDCFATVNKPLHIVTAVPEKTARMRRIVQRRASGRSRGMRRFRRSGLSNFIR